MFIEGELKPFNRMRSNKTLHNVKSYHTSSEDVGKIAKISKAKKLVLTHFVPPQFNKQRLIIGVGINFLSSPKFINYQTTHIQKYIKNYIARLLNSDEFIKDRIKFALRIKPQKHDFIIEKNSKPYMKRHMNVTGG